MTTHYVSTAWANSGVTNKSTVDDAASDIASYMDSNISGPFSHYSYGSVSIGSTNGEVDFIKTVLDKIHNDSEHADLTPSETVLIPHDNWSWGYGRNIAYEYASGEWCHGCTVYAGTQISALEARIMSWHEAGHTWAYDSGRTGGEHANAHANCCNSDNQMYEITPMGAAYTLDNNNISYMAYAGDDTPVGTYCNGTNNRQGIACEGYCHTDGAFNYSKYSSCTMNDASTWDSQH
ncbi:hypothetical protein [Halocalculus aciditolerans]|uniref:Uncharacterized protein n=1 Tax=Halocalculus aciditolerans TaxID=1383812 RepID=A0A830F678_9EURY|nr:hypothetical protein [Halocalculus aciditolerans]GGL67293.1 hypothetical protein GCM10009039_26680 [Halocalculus aciditolerans]